MCNNGYLFMLNAVGKVRKVFQMRRKSNLGSREGLRKVKNSLMQYGIMNLEMENKNATHLSKIGVISINLTHFRKVVKEAYLVSSSQLFTRAFIVTLS